MAIRITRNDAGNCINFVGSSNPAYWNACLSAVINSEDSNRVDIINDIRSENEDETQYEFYAVNYSDFADKDNNAFTSAQAMVDYINENANVIGVSGVGADLTDTVVNFRLDQTSTSIIMDNGSSFGVNTIKAVPDEDGTIHIHAIGAGVPNDEQDENDHKHFEKLVHTNVQINGNAVSGGLSDVCNALNELFTVGPFEAVVISDPHSTMVADVNGETTTYTLEGIHAVDPVGNSIFGATQNTNRAGLKTADTIRNAGEYFTFDIRGEGQLGFGLIHTQESYDNGYYTGNATYANPANFATYNSQHGGWQFSHHFHLTPNGSWTNYGSNTGFVRGPGWYNWESQDEWLAGDPVKVKCGIDENGFIAISTLQDDGTTWILHARSSYPVPEGSEYHLGIKIGRNSSFVETVPKVHLLETVVEPPTTMGDTDITVFQDNSGDISGTLASGIQYTGTDDNYDNDGFVTIQTISNIGEYFQFEWSGGIGDANVGLFSHQDHNVSDLQADRGDWSNSDYIYFGARTESNGELNTIYYENGSHTTFASEGGDGYGRVGFDANGRATLWYSSDGSSWTLYKRLNQIAPVGTYSFIWVAQGGGEIDNLTTGTMSFAPTMNFRYIESPDGNFEYPLFATAEEAEYYDQNHGGTTGTGTYHTHTYVDDPTNTTWYMPNTGRIMNGATPPQSVAHTVFQGQTVTYTEITSLTDSDLTPAVFSSADLTYEEGTAVNIQLQPVDTAWATSVDISPAGSGLVYDTASRMLQGTLADVGSDTTYTITVTRANSYGSSVGSFTITATDVTPPTTMLTPWNKALDFSGGSERAQMVSTSSTWNPLMLRGISGTTSVAPATVGNTTDSLNGAPWATAIVFRYDGHNSNQHIWNAGEGNTGDNIYLRMSANGYLYFGWGRGSSNNECSLGGALATDTYWGVYIASNGTRLSGNNATAANLSASFDIYLMRINDSGNWVTKIGTKTDAEGNRSIPSNWTSNGVRMDRSTLGSFTVGGRGSNRSFHGKVASMVVTTLKLDTPMPTKTEAEMMITDPVRWIDDYKVGNSYRLAHSGTNYSNFQRVTTHGNGAYVSGATQVWLMGDGPLDSYSNMIRNYVQPMDQNNTKLNMISMVSNDIQTVSIDGLT